LEADDSRSHFMSNDDDASYGDPVASSTGTIRQLLKLLYK